VADRPLLKKDSEIEFSKAYSSASGKFQPKSKEEGHGRTGNHKSQGH
jgi:hypothetical protein